MGPFWGLQDGTSGTRYRLSEDILVFCVRVNMYRNLPPKWGPFWGQILWVPGLMLFLGISAHSGGHPEGRNVSVSGTDNHGSYRILRGEMRWITG